jgi:hypothetical protein
LKANLENSRSSLKTTVKIKLGLAGALCSMDYIDKVLEQLKDWARRIVDALFGPEPEPEPELIPIPVDNPRRHVR